MSYYEPEANAFRVMKQANLAMCPGGGAVKSEDKDKQIALANGIMLANAVGFGLLQIAEAIKTLKRGD